MKKAYVFSEGPNMAGLTRKTVVLKTTENEVDTYSTFVIIVDLDGMLTEDAYEVDLVAEIPDNEFIDSHTIPIEVPDSRIVELDIEDPGSSESVAP